MPTSSQTCLIIGASHAGAQLATSLRKEGWQGRILVLGDETDMPYHRPRFPKRCSWAKRMPRKSIS